MTAVEQLRFAVGEKGEVSALLCRPTKAQRLLVLAHGAGAGMNHPFMEKLSDELASVQVATLRYQFSYMEERRRVPDPPAVLTATVVAAVRAAADVAPDFPLLAGGQSIGGRRNPQTAGQQALEGGRRVGGLGVPAVGHELVPCSGRGLSTHLSAI